MNAIVWTTLITAVATVSASLGAVWIKSHYDEREQARQAEDTAADNATDRKRKAYEGLAQQARFVLSVAMRVREELKGLPSDDLDHIADLANPLVQGLTEAVALVELTGSHHAGKDALAIWHKAMAVGHFLAQQRIHYLDAKRKDPETVPDFDDSGATEKLNDLDAAIESFTHRARRELDRTPQDQSRHLPSHENRSASRVDGLPGPKAA